MCRCPLVKVYEFWFELFPTHQAGERGDRKHHQAIRGCSMRFAMDWTACMGLATCMETWSLTTFCLRTSMTMDAPQVCNLPISASPVSSLRLRVNLMAPISWVHGICPVRSSLVWRIPWSYRKANLSSPRIAASMNVPLPCWCSGSSSEGLSSIVKDVGKGACGPMGPGRKLMMPWDAMRARMIGFWKGREPLVLVEETCLLDRFSVCNLLLRNADDPCAGRVAGCMLWPKLPRPEAGLGAPWGLGSRANDGLWVFSVGDYITPSQG